MKEIFLSFRPEYFRPLLFGLKKYEYRKRFCSEETRAYLYLSGKVRQVVGVLELGKPIRLDLTRNDYLIYPETLKRVDEYILNRDINAIPIKSLALFDKPINLEDIRRSIPDFMPPQMYFVLENHPLLKSLLEKQLLGDILFVHKHNDIYYDNLAMSVSALEDTEEFKKLYSLYNGGNEKLSIEYFIKVLYEKVSYCMEV